MGFGSFYISEGLSNWFNLDSESGNHSDTILYPSCYNDNDYVIVMISILCNSMEPIESGTRYDAITIPT